MEEERFRRLSGRAARSGPRADADPAVQAPEHGCRVRVFGGFEVTTPHGQIAERDWRKRKARLLFAMLVALRVSLA